MTGQKKRGERALIPTKHRLKTDLDRPPVDGLFRYLEGLDWHQARMRRFESVEAMLDFHEAQAMALVREYGGILMITDSRASPMRPLLASLGLLPCAGAVVTVGGTPIEFDENERPVLPNRRPAYYPPAMAAGGVVYRLLSPSEPKPTDPLFDAFAYVARIADARDAHAATDAARAALAFEALGAWNVFLQLRRHEPEIVSRRASGRPLTPDAEANARAFRLAHEASGITLNAWCRANGLSRSTVQGWIDKLPD